MSVSSLTKALTELAAPYLAARLATIVWQASPDGGKEALVALTPTRAADAVVIQLREVDTVADLWLLHQARSYGPFEVSPHEKAEFGRLVSAALEGRTTLRIYGTGRRKWLRYVQFDGVMWRLPLSLSLFVPGMRHESVRPPGYGSVDP